MRILVTGADGFIGRALVARLLSASPLPGLGGANRELILLDRGFDKPGEDPGVRWLSGDIADPTFLREALSGGVDRVFHLASLPGGAAEADFELGTRTNVHATLNLLEMLRAQKSPARVVFASTIGVYGVPLPDLIDENTIPAPTLSWTNHLPTESGASGTVCELPAAAVSALGRRGIQARRLAGGARNASARGASRPTRGEFYGA